MTVSSALTDTCVIGKGRKFKHILGFGKAFPN